MSEERDLFIDNFLVRIHFIIEMIQWTGLAPWEFEFPFPGSLKERRTQTARRAGVREGAQQKRGEGAGPARISVEIVEPAFEVRVVSEQTCAACPVPRKCRTTLAPRIL